MKRAAILISAPLALMLAGCGSSAEPEAVLETVRATEQAQLQAIAGKDLRGAVRNYADDAVLVTPGRAPATGGDAIAAAFDGMLSDPNLTIEVTPGPAWAAASGDFAVTTSTARYVSSEPGTDKPVKQTISNQTVWHKPTGRPWQIVSDYNVELPTDPQTVEASATL
jgi:ketosteroid isomerase-like protein